MGVERLDGLEGLPDYSGQPNSEYHVSRQGSQTASDNIRRQKENSPDRRLRSPNTAKFEEGSRIAMTARMLA